MLVYLVVVVDIAFTRSAQPSLDTHAHGGHRCCLSRLGCRRLIPCSIDDLQKPLSVRVARDQMGLGTI
jgi:hypothetical protein